MGIIFENYILQLLFPFGIIALCGLLIWAMNVAFYRLMGRWAHKVCIVTGFIGTPLHELGHAFFCVLFGHKVVEMKLYQPGGDDGTLGYVRHSYNKKNVYHRIGNFFIGIGPIVFGCGVLLLLMYLLVPWLLRDISTIMTQFSSLGAFSLSTVGDVFVIVWEILASFFSLDSISDPLWWVFIVPACSIALHMRLSTADIKGSVDGILLIMLALLVLNVVLYFISVPALETVTSWFIYISGFLVNFLVISIFLSALLLLLALITKPLRKA